MDKIIMAIDLGNKMGICINGKGFEKTVNDTKDLWDILVANKPTEIVFESGVEFARVPWPTFNKKGQSSFTWQVNPKTCAAMAKKIAVIELYCLINNIGLTPLPVKKFSNWIKKNRSKHKKSNKNDAIALYDYYLSGDWDEIK